MQIRSLFFTNQSKIQDTRQNNSIKSSAYPNFAPLAKATVSFGMSDPYRGIDLLALPPDRIINICENVLKENKLIEQLQGVKPLQKKQCYYNMFLVPNEILGEGQESYVVKVPRFPYCIRVEKDKGVKSNLGYDINLDKYDKMNHVVANLAEGTKLLRYIPGIPLKIMKHSDTPAGIDVKEALQKLVAENFSVSSFKRAIEQVEDAKSMGIDFDRNGENLLVDAIAQDLTCIDFSPKFHMEEYNPIAFLYHALDVDNTEHAPKILGKLCSAYATRLAEVPVEELNLEHLDMHFYTRGFINDIFNYFPDRELLKETEERLQELIKKKQDKTISEKEFQGCIDEFKWFVEDKLIDFTPKRDYEVW